jgi:uncharacterized membrane protein
MSWISPKQWMLCAAVSVIAFGIFLRLYHLDHRIFWQDEVFAVYRVSGYAENDIAGGTRHDEVYRFKELEKYLRPEQNGLHLQSVFRTASDYSHIPLFHESLLWFWVRLFGDSVRAIRSFSVLISLFAFPLVIWLCWEIFRSFKVGWIAAILLAVSPYQVIYSQEARNYSLWCVMILFSTAAFLRALRLKDAKVWLLYAGSLTAGFYSHSFFHYVAPAHFIFVLLFEKNSIKQMTLSCLGAFLPYLPQLFLIMRDLNHVVDTQTWTSVPLPVNLGRVFFEGLSRLFWEPNAVVETLKLIGLQKYSEDILSVFFLLMGLTTIFLFIFLWRRSSLRYAAIVILIASINLSALLLPDLFFGGRRITISRYLMAFFLMVQLAMSYFVCFCIRSEKRSGKIFGYLLFLTLILAGISSCVWRARQPGLEFVHAEDIHREIAEYMNTQEGSLMVLMEGQSSLRNLCTMFYYLKEPKKVFWLEASGKKPLSIDFDRHPEALLGVNVTQSSFNAAKKWVEGSGNYKLEAIGPSHWRSGHYRVYKINKL